MQQRYGIGAALVHPLRAALPGMLMPGEFDQPDHLAPVLTVDQADRCVIARSTPTPEIVKRNARVILLDGEDLVLIKRTKPGRAPYWVTVGGGVEESDRSVEYALHREVFEELGGTISEPQLVHLITDEVEGGIGVQHIFAARLVTMDLAARTGTEFDKPERGGYEIVRIPFTADAIGAIALMPPDLAAFTAANTTAITSVVDQPVRTA